MFIGSAVRLGALFLLITTTLLASCADQTHVWGIPQETFSERLEQGEHDFLRHLDYRDIELEEVTRLHPGAAFYLGEVYDELGLDELRRRMYRVEVDRGEDPWRRLASQRLLSHLEDEERFEELESASERVLEHYPDEPTFLFFRYLALYERERFEEIVEADARTDGGLRRLIAGRPSEAQRREAELWRAVAAFETREDGWDDAMRSLFLDYPAADEHARLASFIRARNEAAQAFSEAELDLFTAKAALADGEAEEAAQIFLELADAPADSGDTAPQPADIPAGHWLARDMGLAFLRGGYLDRGAAVLEAYLEAYRDAGDGRLLQARSVEYLGRIHIRNGDASRARERFEQAYETYETTEDRRRVLWYILDLSVASEPARALDDLKRYRNGLISESYFDRLLDRLASELVRRRQWEDLRRGAELLDEVGFAETAERFSFLAAEAVIRGYHTPGRGTKGEPAGEATDGPTDGPAREAARALERIEYHPYYRLLAAVRLGTEDELISSSEPYVANPSSETLGDGENGGADEPHNRGWAVVSGYLAFGLFDQAYEEAGRRSAELSIGAIVDIAERIQMRGMHIEALRLMALARNRKEFVLSPRAARILYPRAFENAMTEIAEQEGLDPALFYGLVREESHFSADIVSYAGATGLAQLMPTTAADMAERMRIEDPDLTDPATNLAIGGFYLGHLIERFDGDVLEAVAAYNGGQGRVRRWVRENASLQGPLFHEAMPVSETREYVRKVLVSAAYYGELYEERSVGETVRLFYPDLEAVSEPAAQEES